ncbi:hypothetical protein AB0I81_38675 [Nonomuraea sp. NPDC050404]|uniref:hypothetical protein n=1 Tax=Nonomuraea sp. NPDC050404 TaxID=3155783 RepID=UPI0033FB3469
MGETVRDAGGAVTLKFWNGFTGPDRAAVESLVEQYNAAQYGPLMAASVPTPLPVVIFFIIIQRRFVAGVATTGIK